MTSALKLVLSASDEQPLVGFLRSSMLRSVVIGASKDPNAKIMILLVDPSTRQPVFAIKVPTTDAAEAAVDAERGILAAMEAAASPGLARTIPRVVGAVEHDGRRALVTTALAGRSMAAVYAHHGHVRNAARVAADFAAVERWIGDLHRVPPLDGARGARDTAELLERRFDHVAKTVLEHAAKLDATLTAAVGGACTIVHGDLWLGNVLVSDGKVSGVVDWEAGEPGGDPTRDVARFAHMYALYLDRHTRRGRAVAGHHGLRAGEWGAGVRFALDGNGWFPEIYRGFLCRALQDAGASPDHWRALALSAIAEVAARTDHQEFAQLHLELFTRLACRSSERT